MGYRTLLLDLDAQINTTYSILREFIEGSEGTIYEVFREPDSKKISEVVRPTNRPNLFIVPGTLMIASTEIELVSATLREFKLKTALQEVLPYFHYVIIDTTPDRQPSVGTTSPASTGLHGCGAAAGASVRLRYKGVRIVRAAVYINGKRVNLQRGRDLRRVTIPAPGPGKHRVKIVLRTSRGKSLASVRTYDGCTKSHPRRLRSHRR